MSEKINVNHAFDPELRQAQADFDAYLATRPYKDETGKALTPDGTPMQDNYFDQARDDHYDGTHESYEDLTMTQLADELAYAELTEDQTKIDDISDVLLDKMDAFASAQVTERNPDGMTPEAQMSLFDRIMRYKDDKKEKYLETNGHEISDRVRNEFLASRDKGGEENAPEMTELDRLGERYRETFQRAADAEDGSEEQERLLKEAQGLGSEFHRRQSSEAAVAAVAARNEGNLEEAERQAERARAALRDFIRVNGIEDDGWVANALREDLENALETGDIDSILDVPSHSQEDDENGDEIPAGEFDDSDDQLPPLVPGEGEDGGDREQTPPRRSLRDRWNTLFGRNRNTEDAERNRPSRLRRFVGATVLAAVAFTGGYLLGNMDDSKPAPRENHPEFIQDEIDQNKALQDAGVDDVETREAIIHNPDDFERMVENPEQFQRMMDWRQARIEELMAQDKSLSRSDAAERADIGFAEFIEDLDDEENLQA